MKLQPWSDPDVVLEIECVLPLARVVLPLRHAIRVARHTQKHVCEIMAGKRLRKWGGGRRRGIVKRCRLRVKLDQAGSLLLLRQRGQLVQAGMKAELEFVLAANEGGIVVEDEKVEEPCAVIDRLEIVARGAYIEC